jgi:hypothetical protein
MGTRLLSVGGGSGGVDDGRFRVGFLEEFGLSPNNRVARLGAWGGGGGCAGGGTTSYRTLRARRNRASMQRQRFFKLS